MHYLTKYLVDHDNDRPGPLGESYRLFVSSFKKAEKPVIRFRIRFILMHIRAMSSFCLFPSGSTVPGTPESVHKSSLNS